MIFYKYIYILNTNLRKWLKNSYNNFVLTKHMFCILVFQIAQLLAYLMFSKSWQHNNKTEAKQKQENKNNTKQCQILWEIFALT